MINRNFTPFPTLATERLFLRQLEMDDRQNIFALRSDKEINKYLGREASKTLEDAGDFIQRIKHNIEKNNSIYWVITLKKKSIFVGTICLFNFSSEKNSCEIGYELMKDFQGQGIMTEAVEKVIEYAFQTLQLQQLIAFSHTANQRSTKLLLARSFIKLIEAEKENPDLDIYTLTKSR